jgi:hypothetical protein
MYFPLLAEAARSIAEDLTNREPTIVKFMLRT